MSTKLHKVKCKRLNYRVEWGRFSEVSLRQTRGIQKSSSRLSRYEEPECPSGFRAQARSDESSLEGYRRCDATIRSECNSRYERRGRKEVEVVSKVRLLACNG